MSDTLAIALIGAVVTVINSFLIAWVKISLNRVHREINGRMGELIDTTKKLGNAEGTAEEKARKKTLPKTL